MRWVSSLLLTALIMEQHLQPLVVRRVNYTDCDSDSFLCLLASCHEKLQVTHTSVRQLSYLNTLQLADPLRELYLLLHIIYRGSMRNKCIQGYNGVWKEWMFRRRWLANASMFKQGISLILCVYYHSSFRICIHLQRSSPLSGSEQPKILF